MNTAAVEPRLSAPSVGLAFEYLDNEDAARFLSVSPERLRQSRVLGSLCGVPCPPWLKLGSRVRYRVADLRQWMETYATEHAPRLANADQ